MPQQLFYNLKKPLSRAPTIETASKGNQPPDAVFKKDIYDSQKSSFFENGLKSISEGKVACILFAGDALSDQTPKGTTKPGLPSGSAMFETLAKRLCSIEKMALVKYSKHYPGERDAIPLLIMTSEINHNEIKDYFIVNKYFGLRTVIFFQQRSLPSYSLTGKLAMKGPYELFMTPNGNGGIYQVLKHSGLMSFMEKEQIQYVHFAEVDNLLLRMADPFLLGFAVYGDYEITCKFIEKEAPEDDLPLHVVVNAAQYVLKPSEIDESLLKARNPDGTLTYRHSHILNCLIKVSFLQTILKDLRRHEVARKYHMVQGNAMIYNPITKTKEPGEIVRFELCFYDIFPFATRFGLVEAKKEEEHAIISNEERHKKASLAAMTAYNKKYFDKAGVKITSNSSFN